VNRENYEALLQECLAAYDNGLSPEECLSAFPHHRAELEPLLRQALELRIAYAAAPREGFRQQLRERVLFVAGREATQAYTATPDPDFVAHARARLLSAAGATAQEALRSVPPPRLAFWVNARRRLLERASSPHMQPVPRAGAFVLQRGLSFAVVLIAIAVAGFAYLASQPNPQSVNAEFALLEQDLRAIEAQAAAGNISAAEIIDLSKRTNDLVGRLDTESPLAEKLPAIIERQKEVVTLAASDGRAPSLLMEAQQELTQAEAIVKDLTASAQEPALAPTQSQPLFPPTATASAPKTPSATPAFVELGPNQVYIAALPSDTMFGLDWTEVRTAHVRFVVPSTWTVVGITTTLGYGSLNSGLIRFDGPNIILSVDTEDGESNALIDGQFIQIRSEGDDGKPVSVEQLLAASVNLAPALFHHADSISVTETPNVAPAPSTLPSPTPIPPTSTPSPTPTVKPPSTSTPTSTATPSPTATPTAVPNSTVVP
jgi:hypothetical protein